VREGKIRGDIYTHTQVDTFVYIHTHTQYKIAQCRFVWRTSASKKRDLFLSFDKLNTAKKNTSALKVRTYRQELNKRRIKPFLVSVRMAFMH
jgi:hypothetical protein